MSMTVPYVSPDGWHRHKCHFCAYVWEHADACDKHHNAVIGSHECPGCHKCGWGMGIYSGVEEPRIKKDDV